MGNPNERTVALERFDSTYAAYARALEQLPDGSLHFLVPGEDYALGGIAHHVNCVLVHYLNTLRAVLDAGETETTPGDPPDLFQVANARAREGLTPEERDLVMGHTAELHHQVRTIVAGLDEDRFRAKTPVRYEPEGDPYPTSPADLLDWLSGHYEEHVPQIAQLLATWEGEQRG